MNDAEFLDMMEQKKTGHSLKDLNRLYDLCSMHATGHDYGHMAKNVHNYVAYARNEISTRVLKRLAS